MRHGQTVFQRPHHFFRFHLTKKNYMALEVHHTWPNTSPPVDSPGYPLNFDPILKFLFRDTNFDIFRGFILAHFLTACNFRLFLGRQYASRNIGRSKLNSIIFSTASLLPIKSTTNRWLGKLYFVLLLHVGVWHNNLFVKMYPKFLN